MASRHRRAMRLIPVPLVPAKFFSSSSPLTSGRTADPISSPRYVLSEEQKRSFAEKGYALLPKFLSEEELRPIEEI